MNAEMEFLRATGLDPTTLTPIVSSGAAFQPLTQSSGLEEALKALGKDIANKMEAFGQRLTSLES